jgi:hypothetical protein
MLCVLHGQAPTHSILTLDVVPCPVAVPRPGTYEVKLLNVEAWPLTAVGDRVFSVAAEGVVKLASLDLFVQAGNKYFVQTDNTFIVDVSSPAAACSMLACASNACWLYVYLQRSNMLHRIAHQSSC